MASTTTAQHPSFSTRPFLSKAPHAQSHASQPQTTTTTNSRAEAQRQATERDRERDRMAERERLERDGANHLAELTEEQRDEINEAVCLSPSPTLPFRFLFIPLLTILSLIPSLIILVLPVRSRQGLTPRFPRIQSLDARTGLHAAKSRDRLAPAHPRRPSQFHSPATLIFKTPASSLLIHSTDTNNAPPHLSPAISSADGTEDSRARSARRGAARFCAVRSRR